MNTSPSELYGKKHASRQSLTIRLLPSILVVLLSLAPANVHAVRTGAPAPDFTLADLQGGKSGLRSFHGKVVVLNFWSTTCAPCIKEIPSLNRLYNEMKGDGLVVLGIALDASEKPVREAASSLNIRYPLLIDASKEVYFDIYALFGQPVSLIIDRAGIVQDKIFGEVDWNSSQIRMKLKSYLKGR
ncbi:MAG: TlpA disulfide reductase family protein [Geobacteraceae bacterium]|nr:TlpA disulfide reductase family protein [Geobacteraceae bacterium]